ncbi:cAMP-dependent protein kinase inhibitor alpha-like [Alligator mississippiensis]|uniref:cAMP-dependent protein kinase inhibitor alpha-like n=1 Tax=Alligator mississippiensis TaxID=8496 RepID=A0A151PG88_ALLMI|nr:cAMP-dependent protein kinase inhibitor alpha-like [Alligator mississippiensis]
MKGAGNLWFNCFKVSTAPRQRAPRCCCIALWAKDNRAGSRPRPEYQILLGNLEKESQPIPEGHRESMTEVEPVLDFASSGRTGRRNALPDILGSPAGVSPSDLPLKLAEMSLNADRSQEMQSPTTEVPPQQPQSPELKDTS